MGHVLYSGPRTPSGSPEIPLTLLLPTSRPPPVSRLKLVTESSMKVMQIAPPGGYGQRRFGSVIVMIAQKKAVMTVIRIPVPLGLYSMSWTPHRTMLAIFILLKASITALL
jgi:hypothetical protein